jgi:hypothetical protein
MVVNEGIVGILLLVRVKKIKARRAKLFQQRKNGEKINQIIQTMNQQGENTIIIITMVRDV